jgi:hypothetical protein
MFMFGVPEAKRIKRSEFLGADNTSHGSKNSSRQASPSHPEDHQLQVEVDYGFEYDFISPPEDTQQRGNPISDIEPGEKEDEDGREATFQFRLFTKTTNKSSALPSGSGGHHVHQAIRLSSTPEPTALTDEVSLENAGFIRPRRPDSYHFTSALPEAKQSLLKSQFADVAMSTLDVLLNASTTKWPGAAVPWRVINVTLANSPKKVAQPLRLSQPTLKARPQPRPRPSKKRRILLRRQLAAKSEAKQQQKLSDEAEREKRTRRNREKKVKRKQREKQKKKASEAESNPVVTVTGTTTTVAGP